MSTYDAPAITELGSVADFTRGDGFGLKFDGWRPVQIYGYEVHVPDIIAS